MPHARSFTNELKTNARTHHHTKTHIAGTTQLSEEVFMLLIPPNPNPTNDEAFDLELHPDCCVNQNLCPK